MATAVTPRGIASTRAVGWRGLWIAIVCCVGFVSGARGQTAVVRGTVTAAGDGAPVVGARVIVTGTTLGALTDPAGRFEVAGLSPGLVSLRVLAPGFAEGSRSNIPLQAGQAASVDFRLERAIIQLRGLVVTANRGVSVTGEGPVSVAVVGADEIRRRGVISLDDALPFAPGVIFNAGQIDIRGATGLARGVGSRVLMLLDGHRVLSGVGASIEFDALPVLDVERIEIVKGPHSALYGTNALGGVVNVITRLPPAEPETIVRAHYGVFDTPSEFDFTDERLEMRGLNVQHARRIGRVGTTLLVGRESSDGFRQNDAFERWRLRAKTVFPVESANPWELFVNYTREEEEEYFTWLSEDRPLEVDPEELGDFSTEDDLAIGLTAHPLVTDGLHLQVRPHLYRATVQNAFHDNDDRHSSTRLANDLQLSLAPSLAHAVTLGAETARTSVNSNFLSTDPAVTDLALFGQDDLVLGPRWRASVGARLDYHRASTAESDLHLNPKFGLAYQALPELGLRASVSRGYRAPSVSEQFTSTEVFGFRVVPNLGLSGESAWAGEIGATASLDRLSLDFGVYQSEYRNLIEPAPVPGEFFTFQFQNVSSARVRGLDLGLRAALVPEHLNLQANYVYLDTRDKRTGDALPYRSDHNLTTTLSTWHDRVAVDLRFRTAVDEVLAFPLDDRGAITVVDLRYAHSVLGVDVQARVSNLFQNEYVDVQERSLGASRSFLLIVAPRF